MKTMIFALLAGTAMVPAAAYAQDSGANPEGATPDIIVTAQRYEQRLQDVPISITAMTGEELQARNASTIGDLQYSVPGFSTYRYGPGQEFYQLQGVSNTLGSSTVGLYLDETPLALDRQGNALSVQLVDMERVEVLRGPQATLYGEGSMGGTIRYLPARPRLDAVSGMVEAEANVTRHGDEGYRLVAVANVPLVTDQVGIRIAASYQRDGGWLDNTVTGEADVNAARTWVLRGSLLARPSDRLEISLLASHQSISQDYQDFSSRFVARTTDAVVPTSNDDEYTLAQARVTYDLDFADLSVIGSYMRRDNTIVADLSPFYVPVLPLFGVTPGSVTAVGNANDYNYDIYYGEVRLASQGDRAVRWLIGGSYRELSLDFLSSTITSPDTLPFTLVGQTQFFQTKTLTAFGEVAVRLTDRLTATAGLRYFTQDLVQDTVTTSFGVDTPLSDSATFDSFNPRFNLSYSFSPDSMVYANIAKGFRGGGFNYTPTDTTYRPDQIWTYELGTKHQLFDRRLVLAASVYRSEWSDVQSYLFAPGSPIVIVSNSGNVSGWGADFTVSARPARGLTLSGTYGWNNLAFDEATGDKNPGDPVDGAVRESYSASLDYRFPLSNSIEGSFRLDYQHAGPAQIAFRNFGQLIERPGRDLVNVRVGATIGGLELALFASNLFDEDVPNIIGPFGVFDANLEQKPRVIGVSGRFTF